MIAVNATSSENIEGQDLNYFGHSTIVSPRGKQLLQMGREPGARFFTINTEDVNNYRNEINFLKESSKI